MEDDGATGSPKRPRGVAMMPKKEDVPTMNLLDGPPGGDDDEVREWLDAELEAFKDTKVWSEESQIQVTEVAVSSGMRIAVLAKNLVDSVDYPHCYSSISAKAMGL